MACRRSYRNVEFLRRNTSEQNISDFRYDLAGHTAATGETRSRTGVKKGHLLEEALLYHLQALEALPANVIIPPRIVLSRQSGEEIIKRITSPARPTKELRALMRGDGD